MIQKNFKNLFSIAYPTVFHDFDVSFEQIFDFSISYHDIDTEDLLLDF